MLKVVRFGELFLLCLLLFLLQGIFAAKGEFKSLSIRERRDRDLCTDVLANGTIVTFPCKVINATTLDCFVKVDHKIVAMPCSSTIIFCNQTYANNSDFDACNLTAPLCYYLNETSGKPYSAPCNPNIPQCFETVEGIKVLVPCQNASGLCYNCPLGHFSNQDSNCGDCPSGWCSDPNSCDVCPAGTYSDTMNSRACRGCNPGSFSQAGSTACLSCSPGEYNPFANASSCLACGPGNISTTYGATNCTPCEEGTYSSHSNSSLCQRCPSGQVAPYEGMSYCQYCAAGTFKLNATTCLSCNPGTFSSLGSDVCKKCQPGSYQPEPGSDFCIPCTPGKYNPNTGSQQARDCKVCPRGYYCPDSETATPKKCPKNAYCVEGATHYHSCPPLYTAKSTATSCHPSVLFFVLVLGSAGVVLVLVSFGMGVIVRRRRQRQTKLEEESEKSSLIPEPLPGPVYGGY